MQSFRKRIPTTVGFNEFLFNRIYTVTGIRYHVSVMDIRTQFFNFNMELKEDSWKIIDAPKLPNWVMEAEKKLEYAILENMSDSKEGNIPEL